VTSQNYVNTSGKTRNPAEFPVLAVLLRGPLHGYDLCRRLHKDIGQIRRIGKSQVYALLAKLEREGLVARERVGQENLPAKNIFTLTTQGERTVLEWLNAPTLHVRDMSIEFPVKLWFAKQFIPGLEGDLIARQLVVCSEKAASLEQCLVQCASSVQALCYGFRLAAVRAAIGWLEGSLRVLQSGMVSAHKESEK
jgi:PadR family transcriptional regulator, regulatory protein AphA